MKAFRPAILFLIKFFLIFFLGSGVYGWYVKQSQPYVDGMTRIVTDQLVFLLNLKEPGIVVKERLNTFRKEMSIAEPWEGVGAALSLYTAEKKPVVSVYEGCNGLAIMILYLAFLVAFGGPAKPMMFFVIGGLLFIHLVNLARIFALAVIALDRPDWLFFTHKYLFTAVIYLTILGIWYIWVSRFAFTKQVRSVA